MIYSNKEAEKIIHKAVKDAGYIYRFTYNYPNDTHRSIKCMINGYNYGKQQYDEWNSAIRKSLDAQGVEYKSAGFVECDDAGGWRDPYYAYIVVIARDDVTVS